MYRSNVPQVAIKPSACKSIFVGAKAALREGFACAGLPREHSSDRPARSSPSVAMWRGEPEWACPRLVLVRVGVCRCQRVAFSMSVHCEVVEMRNSADELGYLCSRTANTQCSDCGSELCESRVETCGGCCSIFCPSCLFLHQAQHSKPESADRGKRRERRSA